ncbi:MFS transporter [Streptomyces globisporus]
MASAASTTGTGLGSRGFHRPARTHPRERLASAHDGIAIRYFRGAVITDLLAILAMAGALLALTQHLQLVLGLSPLRTSFWLMPQAILAAGAAFVGAALVKRYPPAHVITGGLLTTATGFGLTVFLAPASPPLLVATMLGLVSLGAGMALALSNDIIMSSVRPERAGQAAATSETAYEVGTTLGTAVLGGLLVSWYTRVSSAGAGGLGLPSDLLDRASSTLAEALIVAGEVGGGTGSLLLAAAKEAFTEAATVTGIAGAGVMVVAAIWALVTLRGVSANLDLAEELERQLH